MNIEKIADYLKENALDWGMLLLYFWIAACGVFFYYRYSRKTKKKSKEIDGRGKWRALINRLKELQKKLMQSDQYIEECDAEYEKIVKDADALRQKEGKDPNYENLAKVIEGKIESAYSRLDVYASAEKMKKKILKGSPGDPQPTFDDDEL